DAAGAAAPVAGRPSPRDDPELPWRYGAAGALGPRALPAAGDAGWPHRPRIHCAFRARRARNPDYGRRRDGHVMGFGEWTVARRLSRRLTVPRRRGAHA